MDVHDLYTRQVSRRAILIGMGAGGLSLARSGVGSRRRAEASTFWQACEGNDRYHIELCIERLRISDETRD
jgi:hypothetical protein